MKGGYSQEQIDEMRKRLYDRGTQLSESVRHQLTDTKIDVSRNWNTSEKTSANTTVNTTDLREGIEVNTNTSNDNETLVVAPEEPPKKRRYRTFVLIGSLIIFVIVAGVSSLFLYFGGNQISNDNIQIAVQGPFSIGGGEVMSLQIGVTNHNSVPIESATLIVKYPPGTRSVGDSPKNLFEERVLVDDILPGGVKSIPVRAVIFGEENTEKNITATIEYRIQGSNGTFYKESEPLVFRISSSPLVIRVDSTEKVASGQLVDVELTVVSNAPSVLQDVLISASYPNGFSYETSEPKPVFGENVWRIKELKPESSETIKLKGVISGQNEETFRINFSAGPAEPDNQYIVGSLLAEASANFIVERPFIDVEVAIDGKRDKVVVLPESAKPEITVDITNTLDETVYDMAVEVVPGGNALSEDSISGGSGFYDSNTGTVRWEVSNNKTFSQILPGDSRALTFKVNPNSNKTTSSFDLVVNVYARRVAESSAAETLIGTSRIEGRFSSSVSLGSQVGRTGVDTGPIPPTPGEVTTYTVTLIAEAGANDVTSAVVETSLPLYVSWLDKYDAEGSVTYNSVSKKIQWAAGDIPTGERKELIFQVSIKPSTSQLKQTPVLVNGQSIRVNDRFTGQLLQDSALPVTTELSTEMGFNKGNGVVVE